MNKNEQVAKIVEEQFGLKTVKGTYTRNKREPWEIMDGYWAWTIDVDDDQFPPVGTPIEKLKCIKVWDMFDFRGWTWEQSAETVGIYDEYFDNRISNTYKLGSTESLQDILDTFECKGAQYIYIKYNGGGFELCTSNKPLDYKGDYNEMKSRLIDEITTKQGKAQ